MKTGKIDHISVAVRSLDGARKAWEPILGKAEPDDVYSDEGEKIRVARYWLGGTAFELMESTTAGGPVAQWIERHDEGVMVLSLKVDNTRKAVEELQSLDYPFVPSPETGVIRPFRDSEFAFIHPKKVNNVLLELIDCAKDGPIAGGDGQ